VSDVAAVSASPRRRRRHTSLWAAASVGFIVALLVAVLATSQSASSVEGGSPLIGKAAPAVAGPDITGRQVSLSDFRGRYVLVNFFATWCVPCQREQPDLVQFSQRHATTGDVVLLGIIYQDDPALVAKFFAKQGGGWPVIRADRAKLDFGTTGVPETFLIDPNGIVLKRVTGQVSDAGLEQLVSAAESLRA
jgi:cytochrome c biogenesis protein CcmG, thiol:disulfide interchange protein DsbE